MSQQGQRPHFSVRQALGSEDLPLSAHDYTIEHESLMSKKSTDLLFVVASWSWIGINLMLAALSVRDMINTVYTPATHAFMCANFVATLGALTWVHNNILKRR